MKRKLRLYLSGPMTGYHDKNFPAFIKAAAQLRKAGYEVVNPAELDENEPEYTWEECLRRDIKAEMTCDGVATLPGWKDSRGAKLEVYIACSLAWTVRPVEYWRKNAFRK